MRQALSLLIILILTGTVFAQPGPGAARLASIPPSTITLSRDAEISILTMLPGDAIYSAYGHTAIRVHDPAQALDAVFNYGVFNFSDPYFILKFAWGKMDYMLDVEPFDEVIRQYRWERRPMIEQVLNLTQAQKQSILDFLLWNVQPAHRTYRYRFLRDNCSTRVRDVVERAVGPSLRFPLMDHLPLGRVVGGERGVYVPAPAGDPTYRNFLWPYTAASPWLWAGESAMLGLPADHRLTGHEAMFLPLPLFAAFEKATRADPDPNGGTGLAPVMPKSGGTPATPVRRVPLVKLTRRILWPASGGGNGGAGGPPPISPPWPMLVLGAVAVVWTGQAAVGARRGWRVTRLMRGLDALLLLIVGLYGLLVVVLWAFSAHDVIGPNLNLIWAWPTHIVAAGALLLTPRARWLRPYLAAVTGVTFITVILWGAWPQALRWGLWPVAALLVARCAWLAWKLGVGDWGLGIGEGENKKPRAQRSEAPDH